MRTIDAHQSQLRIAGTQRQAFSALSMFPIMFVFQHTTGKLDKLVHSLLIHVNIGARANACLTTLAWLSTETVRLCCGEPFACVRSRYWIASARAYIVCVDAFFSIFLLLLLLLSMHTIYIRLYWFYFIWTRYKRTTFLSTEKTFYGCDNNDKCAHLSIQMFRCIAHWILWFDLLSLNSWPFDFSVCRAIFPLCSLLSVKSKRFKCMFSILSPIFTAIHFNYRPCFHFVFCMLLFVFKLQMTHKNWDWKLSQQL